MKTVPTIISSGHMLQNAATCLQHCANTPGAKVMVLCGSETFRGNAEKAVVEVAGKCEITLNWFEPHKCRVVNGSEIHFNMSDTQARWQ